MARRERRQGAGWEGRPAGGRLGGQAATTSLVRPHVPRPLGRGVWDASEKQRLLVSPGPAPALSVLCGAACMAVARASEENSSPEVVTVTPRVASTPHTPELSRAFARCFHTHNPTPLSPSAPPPGMSLTILQVERLSPRGLVIARVPRGGRAPVPFPWPAPRSPPLGSRLHFNGYKYLVTASFFLQLSLALALSLGTSCSQAGEQTGCQ